MNRRKPYRGQFIDDILLRLGIGLCLNGAGLLALAAWAGH